MGCEIWAALSHLSADIDLRPFERFQTDLSGLCFLVAVGKAPLTNVVCCWWSRFDQGSTCDCTLCRYGHLSDEPTISAVRHVVPLLASPFFRVPRGRGLPIGSNCGNRLRPVLSPSGFCARHLDVLSDAQKTPK